GRPPAAGRRPAGADRLPHRPRRHRGQGGRAHHRRRRLRHQALLPRRARGPGAGRAAADGGRAGAERPAADRRPRARQGQPPGQPGRPARRAHGHGVQAAPLPDDERPAGAVEGPDPRPRLELRLRRRRQHRGDLHLLSAQEGRRLRATADPDRAGGRLHAAATGLMRSLRARLVAGLLALTVVGLGASSAGIYKALADYLHARLDAQLRDSQTAVVNELAQGRFTRRLPSGRSVIPSGTFGELRRPDGTAVQYAEQGRPIPKLPDPPDNGQRLSTVGSVSGSVRYRVLASSDDDGDTLYVAFPTTDLDETLHRLVG